MKAIKIGKKQSMFVDYMILYMGKPQYSTRNLLKLINPFGKVTKFSKGYKINIQKTYTSNYLVEREIPFTIVTKF